MRLFLKEYVDNHAISCNTLGELFGIDELALSQGELYTVVINKEAHGIKGSIIAIIHGTEAQKVSSVLLQMSRRRRFKGREITLDMTSNIILHMYLHKSLLRLNLLLP